METGSGVIPACNHTEWSCFDTLPCQITLQGHLLTSQRWTIECDIGHDPYSRREATDPPRNESERSRSIMYRQTRESAGNEI
jgi:hypothetical protein